jgi:L-iditol 2-dehydrogenase
MLAAVFRGPNNIAVEEVPVSSRQAVLKVNACAVCGYDARVFKNGHRKVSPPVILGHELCGEIQNDIITQAGNVIRTGTRVAVCPLVPCLNCPYCQSSQYNLCMNLGEIGSNLDGGFAQYMTIPKQIIDIGGLIPLPDGLSDEEAALLEPLACCLNSFSYLSPVTTPVVIIGDGPIGLLHLQLFKKLAGANKVAVVGKISSRMQRAMSMGADAVFSYQDSNIDKTMFDVLDFAGKTGSGITVISTSNPAAFEFATKIAGKGSKINLFAGMPSGQTFPLDANWLHYNQVSINGTFSSTPAMLQEAARIAAEKIVDLSQIVTHRYSLTEIEKAMIATEKYYGLRAVINSF